MTAPEGAVAATAAGTSPASGFRPAIALVVAFGLFMQSLDATIIATALPAIARSLDTPAITLSMAMTSYMLSLAVFIPVSGWMADRFGARTVFCAALLVFTGASLLCGTAESLLQLVAARILQGMGGAMMTPVGRLIMLRSYDRADYIRAMSYVTVPALIGPSIGPVLGGLIANYTSWRWIFYVNLPIGLVGVLLAFRLIPNLRVGPVPKLDVRGFLLCGTGLAALVLGLEGLAHGVLPPSAEAAMLGGGMLLLGLFVLHARRHTHPVLRLTLFRLRAFRASVVGGTLCRIGFGATPFLLPVLFQVGFGWSPLRSGLVSAVGGLGALLMKTIAPWIVREMGFRRLLVWNGLVVALVMASLALFEAGTPLALIVATLGLFGFLRALQFTCANALAYADLQPADISAGTSLASAAQELSQSLGVATGAVLLHAVLSLQGAARLEAAAFPPVFLAVAVLPLLSILVFRALPADVGAGMSGQRREAAAGRVQAEM